MANNPTVVIGSLNDEELKKSIDKLVNHVDQQLNYMVSSTKVAVMSMNKSLKSLGDTKIDFGGSADGGASKRAKAQNAETDAVEKNVAARDKQIKKNQEAATSCDNFAKAQQVAIRSANPSGMRNAEELQTMNIQLDLLRERLREARQQYSSFVALAAHATTTGDKGLFQFATEGVHRYETEVRNLIPQIRNLQNGIQQMGDVIAPQGHAIQNYVNSLQKANPELAQMNERFKRGQSLMQNGGLEARKMTSTLTNGTNQSKESLDGLNAAIQQTIQREQQSRETIRQTGIEAQQAYRQIVQSAREQLELNTDKPIQGVKELGQAIIEMRRAYFDMSENDRQSPLGQSLKDDIEKAIELRKNIDAFNRTLSNIPTRGIKADGGIDKGIGSYERLSNLLKELTDEYKNLGREERNAEKGADLAGKIQRTSREIQKIQQQMNRPVNFDAAKNLSEKTLDDMTYKLRQLQSYKMGLNVKEQVDEMKQVDTEIVRLKKRYDELMSKNQQMIKSNTALGRSWTYMKNRLAFYFTVGASTAFIKNLIEVRSQYEMNERALGILIDSAERGTQIFNELSQMALVSPYTLIELSTAAKQLTAYDVAAKDVVDTTRRLADMASAVGIPIERLTYALGQIKAYGYLNSRDARMFANAGIPLVKQLADYYTELEGKLVSTADIYDRIKKKTIDYNDVMSVMYKMTDEGGKFFDFQAKMADTLKVRLANLTLAWNNMLNDMGKESQGVLTWGIGALRELFLQWRTFDKTLKEAAGAFGLYKAIQLIILGLQTATKSTLGLNARLTATGVLGTRLVTIFKALGSAMKSLAANWWLILVAAAVELSSAIINANEATKEFNKSMRESAESTANDLKKYIEQYKDLRDSLYKTQTQTLPNGKTKSTLVPQDIDKNEASKAWEAMREQIELSSAASTDFVSRLLQIENVSDRLREGFKIIDDITQVNSALKDMGDEALVVTQKWSAWWNAWQAPDGLFTNLKEFKVELDEIRQKYGDIANARYVAEHGDINRAANEQDAIMRAASEAVNDYDREMNRFRVDLDKYTSSLDNFANAMEFSSNPTQVAELYAKAVKQLVTQGQLNPQEAFDLQLQIEEARTNAMKLALQSRISDEESALKVAQDERVKESLTASIESNKAQLKLFENSTYEQTAYWNDFTKYIKERHISELSAAYNAMTDNGKKEMDFQSSEWQKYVHKWANSYEKSHNLATDSVFNRIKNWINDANTWSIFIKMTISTEDKKSVYKELGEWDKAADDAYKTMQRLDKEISRLRKKGAKEVGVILENNASADDKKLTQAIEERTQAQKDYNEAVANGGESKKENAAASKAQKAAESELAKALKDELKLIETVRSAYKDRVKDGMSHADAVAKSVSGYEKSVTNINKVLEKYGIKLDLTKFAGIANPHELQEMLNQQLNALAGKAKPTEIQALEVELKKVDLDVDKYDLTKITKGLNNELDRLKEEYELAVALDADPEMGNLFADFMGINVDELPRTFQETAKRAQKGIDKLFAENNRTDKIDIVSMLDKESFDRWVKDSELAIDSELVKAVEQFRQYLHKTQTEEIKNTSKEWNTLVEKYGDLQSKLLKIHKETVQEQVNIIKQFGDQGNIQEALELQARIRVSDSPEEIRALQESLSRILQDVAERNPQSIKIATAVANRGQKEQSKAYWEDFKDSELYTMTFEDMANNSTRAIETIISKLDSLKDRVKDDPVSMKALTKSIEDARKELEQRNPFGAFAQGLEEWKSASVEVEQAQQRLALVNEMVARAQKAKEVAKTPEERKVAETAYTAALKAQKDAELQLIAAENNKQRAWSKMKGSLQGLSNQLGNVKGLFDSVSSLFRAFGDDDTADAIDAISEGFSIMTTLIMGVVAAMIILESTTPWLLAIAAALSVIVGLVSWLSGNDNEKITEKVEDSERAVKRLEIAYKRLEVAVEEAYGAAKWGAQQAAIANKKLQLVELQRQLYLERSRDSKNRDESKILDLQGQIEDLKIEIEKSLKEITNDLLGISSVGNAAEELVSSMIEAFKQGEDYMLEYDQAFDKMVDNMIMKAIVGRVIGDRLQEIWDNLDALTQKRGEPYQKQIDEITKKMAENQKTIDTYEQYMISGGIMTTLNREMLENAKNAAEKSNEELRRQLEYLQSLYTDAVRPTPEDVQGLRDTASGMRDDVKREFEAWMELFGIKFGEDAEAASLSNLQQGISSVTEETAGAIEAYMNGLSQQAYLRNDILVEIRDAIMGFDLDIQAATMTQILLQLQSTYQLQMSMHNMMEGWTNASGQAVRVELIS